MSGPRRLRVVIVTQEDPFYVREFFDAFVHDPRLAQAAEVQCVLIQPPFRESKWNLARRMLGFWGPLGFLRMTVRLFRLRVRGHSCRALLQQAGFACCDEADVNSPECIDRLRQLSPDVILSVAAPQIFKGPLLNVPSWGCVNVHSGPLPRYRGMMPVFWQMLHGEKQIGVTVHMIAKEIDGGDILKQVLTDRIEGESLTDVILRTKRLAARLVVETIENIRDGRVTRTPMSTEEGSYFSFPKPADVQSFCCQGGKLL